MNILPHTAVSEFAFTDVAAIHAKRTSNAGATVRHQLR
jgi:hypothetical protein